MQNFKIIIQVRLTSTRLPRKVLKKIYKNESMLEFLLNRLTKRFKNDDVIVALAKNKMNLVLSIGYPAEHDQHPAFFSPAVKCDTGMDSPGE